MKKKHLFSIASLIIIFFVTVIFTACETDEPEQYGNIIGIVFEEGTNNPIQGATLVLSPTGTTKTTGSDGKFEYKNLVGKEYTLQASKEGYITNTKTVTVSAGEDTKADISLTPVILAPTLSTANPVIVSSDTATVDGIISDLGSGNITAHGHVWSTSPAPTVALTTKVDYGARLETGVFTSTLSDLAANTEYYVRAYATYNEGTEYSNEVSFTTPEELLAPTASTQSASSVSHNAAILNGIINANGYDAAVTFEYGLTIDYGDSINASPNTVTGNINTNVSADITGLEAEKTYHFRVKAVNSGGTTYGSDITFTTTSIPAPTATTQAATYAAQTTSVLNGIVNANGSDATVSFEYGTTTSYGSTVNATPGTATGSSNTSVSTNLTSLTTNTTYRFRVKAVNAGGTTYGGDMSFTTFPPGEVVTDYEGNIYQTVVIGTQTWMAGNLKSTKYADGISLVDGTGAGDISGDLYTKYYFAYEDNESNVSIYGKLYTWAAVMNGASSSSGNPSGIKGVCPDGWHLPSDTEWTELTDYLGGEAAGGKLKETGTTHWTGPNTGATNETGFTALPGGLRYSSGAFQRVGNAGYFWSATKNDATNAWYRKLGYDYSSVYRGNYGNSYGFSVRCVKDIAK